MKVSCPLCNHEGQPFYQSKKRDFYECTNCTGVFVDPNQVLDTTAEKQRYDNHSDDINNKGYQNFVSPSVLAVQANFSQLHKGLDFGCGKSEIVAKLLQEKQYDIVGYDPFYKPQNELLKEKYDYITSCEVVEHFNTPAKEFRLLKSMLNRHGKLILQTNILKDEINFEKWWYKNDVTHVFFYTPQCFQFLQSFFGFSSMEIGDNLIVFSV